MSKPRSTINFSWIVFGLAISAKSWAAPCCAGNAAAPALISGDDTRQLSLTSARSTVIGDAPVVGIPVFRSLAESEVTHVYKLDGAMLMSDRWQAGATVPLVQRQVMRSSVSGASTGLGDIKINLGYEILPEWSYSAWKPKGYLFMQLSVPTGKSIYDSAQSSETVGADVLGRGFYSAALGSVFMKRWSSWDAFTIPELHYSIARSFDVSGNEAVTVYPGWGASLAVGFGYSVQNLRLGFRLQPVYDQPKKVLGVSGQSVTPYQLAWNTGVDGSYLLSDDWSLTAGYTDQTLLGPAVNTTLSRTIALGLSRKWPR